MNCSIISSCFQNKTHQIVDILTDQVMLENRSDVVKNIQLIMPVIISIGVLDHIRRAVALSRDRIAMPLSEIHLNGANFKISVAVTLLNMVTGVPDYLDWFDKASAIDSVTKKIFDYDVCSKRNKAAAILKELDQYSDELNNSFSSIQAYLLTGGAILTMTFIAAMVHLRDYSVNGQVRLFKAHTINYVITYATLVMFYAFQTYILARMDLNPTELRAVYQSCVERR